MLLLLLPSILSLLLIYLASFTNVMLVPCSSENRCSFKRIALNRHLLERFISLLDLDSTSIKSHPRFPDLCSYGAIVY